jgi:hypothetical protein|tara:strand:- start:1146 stop:1523 length:378 start_codon:yes stop_codon:yes gene_type:complete
MKIEVSNGEIVDKMTILQIKSEKIDDPVKVKNILNEISSIEDSFLSISSYEDPLYWELKTINRELWKIEDDIREKERDHRFDDEFISLARNVYIINDKRALTKHNINMKTNSNLIEEKSYAGYEK